MDLKDSRTKQNLMRAFAGESQARNRYTFAAELAQQNGLYVIKKIFDFTAEQEKEHARVYYDFLKEAEGENINIDAAYPVNTSKDILSQLKNALHNEYEEADSAYKEFGDIAKEEGFTHIAGKFYLIADIERTHAKRFEQVAKLMEENKLFVSDVKTGWMCLGCGYVVESEIAPQNCPVCDSGQGFFIRMSMAPYVCNACSKQ
ncbi:MAG: rubrerythrin family protein [Lachnospiraceae bacterium]